MDVLLILIKTGAFICRYIKTGTLACLVNSLLTLINCLGLCHICVGIDQKCWTCRHRVQLLSEWFREWHLSNIVAFGRLVVFNHVNLNTATSWWVWVLASHEVCVCVFMLPSQLFTHPANKCAKHVWVIVFIYVNVHTPWCCNIFYFQSMHQSSCELSIM